jgi:hypothetical protein
MNSIKGYAPIAPIKLLRDLRDYNLLGNYHLVLTQEVLKHSTDYAELFSSKGYFVILDNGAAEGFEASPSDIIDASHVISASAICLPDELRNRTMTLRLIETFMQRAQRRMFTANWMAIPQGKTKEDIIRCAKEIVKSFGAPRYWGVPRWITNEFGSRTWLVRELMEHPDFDPMDQFEQPFIHILGMSQNLKDDLMCAKMLGVMGIDSANPIVMGQKGIILNEPADYVHLPRQTDTWNFWEENDLKVEAIRNIRWMRKQINEQ